MNPGKTGEKRPIRDFIRQYYALFQLTLKIHAGFILYSIVGLVRYIDWFLSDLSALFSSLAWDKIRSN